MLFNPLFCIEENFYPVKLKKKYKHTLAICAIFRNEAPYLKEWIEFHRLVGVEKFYLYNNCSTDDFAKVLNPYVEKGEVELIDWPYDHQDASQWSPIQNRAYNHCLRKVHIEVKWLAILDVDEFLFPVKTNNLKDFLKNYDSYGALAVNWQMYGTSNVSKIPANKLMIEMLNLKAPTDYSANQHVKSIVRPELVRRSKGPHFCVFNGGSFQVNPDKKTFEGAIAPYVSVNKIRINHYWTRDLDFFNNVKVKRREGWQEGLSGIMQRHDEVNKVFDDSISRFVPALRKRMFSH